VPGPEIFFFKAHQIIIGVVFCVGLGIWGTRRILRGLRILTREICDWYEELRERKRRWRQEPPTQLPATSPHTLPAPLPRTGTRERSSAPR